jgi:hypothetical protein
MDRKIPCFHQNWVTEAGEFQQLEGYIDWSNMTASDRVLHSENRLKEPGSGKQTGSSVRLSAREWSQSWDQCLRFWSIGLRLSQTPASTLGMGAQVVPDRNRSFLSSWDWRRLRGYISAERKILHWFQPMEILLRFFPTSKIMLTNADKLYNHDGDTDEDMNFSAVFVIFCFKMRSTDFSESNLPIARGDS